MSRRVALPLLASGIALLALTATVLPFESTAKALSGSGPWARLHALHPVVAASLLLSMAATVACWHAPRHPVALLFLALALGALGGTATLVALPDVIGASPALLAVGPG